MILTDAGPLIALLDRDDFNHTKCFEAAEQIAAEPLLTTWPCFAEAMYLLGEIGSFRYQTELWKLPKAGRLLFHDLSFPNIERMAALMEKYQDVPMDLADASLIAVAETLSLGQVFTVDSDFNIYRLADGTALKIIP